MIAGIVIVEMVLFIGPLFLLGPALLRARTRGIFQYGAWRRPWGSSSRTDGSGPEVASRAEALSAPDFSATTDLYSIAANAHGMGLVPLKIVQVVPLVIAVLLPFVPVVLVALPINEILSYAAKLVL